MQPIDKDVSGSVVQMSSHASSLDTGEDTSLTLHEHQLHAQDGNHHFNITDLHSWVERMLWWFDLDIRLPTLMIADLRGSRLGYFRCVRNSLGRKTESA